MLLLDVTPLSLGIETLGGVMTVLIPRNTTIPTQKSEIFSTAADNQTSVEVHVLQGERPLARDNRTLGKFHLVGIPPAPRGVPADRGDLRRRRQRHRERVGEGSGDRARNRRSRSRRRAASARQEVDRMVKEAQSHAAEDQQRRALIDARNEADALAYSVEKSLNEMGGQLGSDERARVESAIAEVRKVMQQEDLQAITRAVDDLQRAARRAGRGGGTGAVAAGCQVGAGRRAA